ncbi:phage tail protein [Escherichia coli]|uniref:Phage tail protein n=1 Tax=Escherichia coli TaxID=562 RepID=A0A6D0FZM3_ECOLX|nr:phage tail protein [Escherichia coli]KAE9730177.1 phage tail protein [Escherichia coli]KAE9737103.1 phage tail protein [Escherichia coli]MVV60809.1 phage tail protein [Escherichia coli]MVV68136.1 phage tail protein [Escherichia coli]MWN41456.1 phage tail protein [Escherichia coli]
MHRIDTLTAVKDKFGPGKNGFTDGNLRTGRLATWLNSAMWDAIQEEICGVIEKAGIELNKEEHDQLYKAILLLVGGAINKEALLIKNNLSDVEDKDEAVENLGLKPTVDKAKNAVQRDGDTMTGKLTLPQTSGFGVNTDNALGGNSIAFGDNDTGLKQNGDGILDVYANGQHVFRFQNGVAIALKNIQAGNAKKFTLSSANNSTKNATFNLWGNSSRPVVAELGDDSGWHFYSQRNTDGSITFAVNGQMTPSNYGNFDARYQQRNGGVQDVRYGSEMYYTPGSNVISWTYHAPAGHGLSGISDTGKNSADNVNGVYYRPLQKLINGTWYNVASV